MDSALAKQYAAAELRLMLLDYDGTLVNIAPTAAEAVPTPRTLQLLRTLAADPSNFVIIVSGRTQTELDEFFHDLPNLSLSAEHGAFVKPAGSPWRARQYAASDWQAAVLPYFQAAVLRAPGSFIEPKQTALAWHYRLAERAPANKAAHQLLSDLNNVLPAGLVLQKGHQVIEVKHVVANKGRAAEFWLEQQARSGKAADFILAAGDDNTDEDLFEALPPGAHTFRIGAPAQITSAAHILSDPAALLTLLETLAADS